MKRFLKRLGALISLIISTTAGASLVLGVCCIDGSPYICGALILVSLAWLCFRAWVNSRKYGSVDGGTNQWM